VWIFKLPCASLMTWCCSLCVFRSVFIRTDGLGPVLYILWLTSIDLYAYSMAFAQ
jgi:hypothetical protein